MKIKVNIFQNLASRLRAGFFLAALMLADRGLAQTFTTLYSFSNGIDGGQPHAGLVLSGGTLYGTATQGGTNGNGTVFAINTNGTGFTSLYSFTALDPIGFTNRDGFSPQAGLILSGNTLYGTAAYGGTNGSGTVFSVSTNGGSFTTLHSFTALDQVYYTNSDGASPEAGLILSGNTLYGTTYSGGTNANGTVFAVNTNGSGFTTLHSFTALDPTYHTNSDGARPVAGLILSGNILFGTANSGGTNANGTVFSLNTDGTGFTTLHSFTALDQTYYTNSDGANPEAGLILSGNTLYGTAYSGGTNDNGTVFAVSTNGTGFTTLHSFNYSSDGAYPQAGLFLAGNTLYGTTGQGGTNGSGTAFAVYTNGTGFTTLHTFTAILEGSFTNTDGGYPQAGLILSDNTLYGTASQGGTNNNNGTVFSLSLGLVAAGETQLTIIPSGADIILAWATNATGFTLEFATNLVPPVVWNTNSAAPVVINGQNTVTIPNSGTQMYFRLSQ